MALVYKYMVSQSNSVLLNNLEGRERERESWDKTECRRKRPHSTVRKDRPKKVLGCGEIG
jgi:hypothetical protein